MENVKEILSNNGLDWSMGKAPLYYNWNDETVRSNKYSLFRMDTGDELNVVGAGYLPMQNEVMVEATLKAAENYGELKLIKAGHFHKGKKVFIQFEINGMKIIGDEKLTRYITLINHNDCTGAFKFVIGNKVMSCSNQFHYFNSKSKLNFRHSLQLQEISDNLDKHIDLALSYELKLIEKLKIFQSNIVSKDLALKMINEIIVKDFSYQEGKKLSTRMQKKADIFIKAIDMEMENKGNNAFGLFNGFTYATNHLIRGVDNGLLYGEKANINKKAFEYLENLLIH